MPTAVHNSAIADTEFPETELPQDLATQNTSEPRDTDQVDPGQMGRGWRWTALQAVEVLRRHQAGVLVEVIGQELGLTQQRVSDVLAAYHSTTEHALQPLQAKAFAAAEHWAAIASGERKGDHRAAEALLKACKVIDNQPTTQVNIVVIGVADQPQANPWKRVEGQVIEAKVLTNSTES